MFGRILKGLATVALSVAGLAGCSDVKDPKLANPDAGGGAIKQRAAPRMGGGPPPADTQPKKPAAGE